MDGGCAAVCLHGWWGWVRGSSRRYIEVPCAPCGMNLFIRVSLLLRWGARARSYSILDTSWSAECSTHLPSSLLARADSRRRPFIGGCLVRPRRPPSDATGPLQSTRGGGTAVFDRTPTTLGGVGSLPFYIYL